MRSRCLRLPFPRQNLFWSSFPVLFAISPHCFSQHLNANHTSPFLSAYARGIPASSQPLSPIWNASSVSLIVLSTTCGRACIEGGSRYSARAPRKEATVVSLPPFSDHCFQKTSNVVTPEPLRIRPWWDEEEQKGYFEGGKSYRREMSLWSLATEMGWLLTKCNMVFQDIWGSDMCQCGAAYFYLLENRGEESEDSIRREHNLIELSKWKVYIALLAVQILVISLI